jgi:Reverse transcriptase (RNA-dependent DNA polymerase)
MENRKLAKYLGPSHDVGQAMCVKLLVNTIREITRSSVIPLSVEDKNNEQCKEKLKQFESTLLQSLGDRAEGLIPLDEEIDAETYEPYEDDDKTTEPLITPDEIDLDEVSKFINARVLIPRGGELYSGTVIKRKRDDDNVLIGKSNKDPKLDTSLYEVQLDDGAIECVSANLIAEHMYEQIDEEGHLQKLIDEIIDHQQTSEAVHKDDELNSEGKQRQTTKGWKLCVKWRDGSVTWERLATMKDGYPIETAEYAVSNKLQSQPGFNWWVSDTLRTRDRIISKVNTRYLRREVKYGIAVPKSVTEALKLDQESGTTHWADAIKREMKVILPAMKILDHGSKPPVGYQRIPCHMVFDVKIDFQRKARYVGGGHVTQPPATQTYASVVGRDSVRIAFVYASLNQLDVLCADVQGAYLNAPCKERVYTICGPEFGPEHIGKVALIEKALYGLRTSAFAWREDLSRTLEHHLGFVHCLADNDVWMRPATKSDGSEYYELVLVHTDDLMVVSHKPRDILNQLVQHYVLKPGSIGPPTTYLGAEVGKYILNDDPVNPKWYMSADKYVKESMRNVKEWLKARN